MKDGCVLHDRDMFERLREAVQLGGRQKWLPEKLVHKWQMHYNNEAVERKPKDFSAYHAFGMMLLGQGHFTQAMPLLKKAIKYCDEVGCFAPAPAAV